MVLCRFEVINVVCLGKKTSLHILCKLRGSHCISCVRQKMSSYISSKLEDLIVHLR